MTLSTLRVIRFAALACSLMTIGFSVSAVAQRSRVEETRVRQLADEYLGAYRARYPESTGTQTAKLFDNSRGAYARWGRTQRRYLSRVARIAPRTDPTSTAGSTIALLKEHLGASRDFEVCHRELWNVSPVTGWLSEYRQYATQQPVGSDLRRAEALERWRQLPAFIDREVDNLRYGESHGFSAPRTLVVTTIGQLDRVTSSPVEASPFYSPAARDSNPAFRAAFERLVRDSINPATKRYRSFLANEYLPLARTTVGVTDTPGGAKCFRALVRRYTSLTLRPEDLDSSGRALLRRGVEERASMQRARGLRGTSRELHDELVADTANSFLSAEQVTRYAGDALARAWKVAPRWFGHLPTVPVPVIDSLPGADDSDPTAQYVPGSQGDSTSKVLINLSSLLKPGGKLYLERVMFHEGVPGHHLQIALERSAHVNPLNRVLWSPAFVEGWAVYASNLADEMGLYTSDASRFPLVEGLVDDGLTLIIQSGLHAHGWSRAQAVDTMLAYSSDSRAEIEQQVDYFIAAPGHALAYPIGAREIERLRLQAKLALGPRFDVRRFHDAVLARGPVPLVSLKAIVAQWITAPH